MNDLEKLVKKKNFMKIQFIEEKREKNHIEISETHKFSNALESKKASIFVNAQKLSKKQSESATA